MLATRQCEHVSGDRYSITIEQEMIYTPKTLHCHTVQPELAIVNQTSITYSTAADSDDSQDVHG